MTVVCFLLDKWQLCVFLGWNCVHWTILRGIQHVYTKHSSWSSLFYFSFQCVDCASPWCTRM